MRRRRIIAGLLLLSLAAPLTAEAHHLGCRNLFSDDVRASC